MKTQLAFFACIALVACSAADDGPDIDELAEEYLFLELSMGRHDTAHVDAYFGPEAFRAAAQAQAMSLEDVRLASGDLARRLAAVDTGGDEMLRMRVDGLIARLQALDTRIAINLEEYPDFDAESLALFGSQAPDYDAGHFQAILDEVDALLPGDGPLAGRVEAFNDRFVIPPDRMDAVFKAALDECRRRTLEHVELPDNESFTIEYVNDKPWTGYNWYQGNARSLIQLNTDFPMYISKAVDLGCHEGYPGHHTFNALLEKNLVEDQGWIEYALYPLFSPQSLIAEGSGNYGIDLAFPGEERMAFEKEVLFPLAGLDAGDADLYYEVFALIERLDYADNEAARDYLNGNMTREDAAAWINRYELERADKSLQRTRFFDAYRSYVINYNHGKALVADYVERGDAGTDERWARFEKMLSSPMQPGDLL
ncbi:MAG: hypothetical protein MJA32_11745 [Proteobacteria bacterium]|nr:hypothetical protein [Pseudomonadota bacterium]